MSSRPGFRPVPYVAKYKWVYIEDINKMNPKEWTHYLTQSYEPVKNNLSRKLKKQLGLK